VLSGVLSRDVARVDLQLFDGRTIRAPVTDGPAYTGRYAGLVRFVAIALPEGAFVRRASARDADGRRLGLVFVEGGRTRTIRHHKPPGLVLTRTRTTSEGHTRTFVCLQLRHTHGLLGRIGLCDYGDGRQVETRLSVQCTPRQAVLFGSLPRGSSEVSLILRGGARRAVAVRRYRGLGRVWVTALPRHARVMAIDYGRRAQRLPFRVLPAARQCGYDDLREAF
jgi:hypothetical protein